MSDPDATIQSAIQNLCRRTVAHLGNEALTVYPGENGLENLTIQQAYIPLLVDYTLEDEKAKGLRTFAEERRAVHRPMYFSALERLADDRRMFLLAGRGAGKTTFARHVSLHLAGETVGSKEFNASRMCNRMPRSDQGDLVQESWPEAAVLPLYLPVSGDEDFNELICRHWPEHCRILESADWRRLDMSLLLVVDGIDRLRHAGNDFLGRVVDFLEQYTIARALVTGATEVCETWPLPGGFVKRRLLPLSAAGRRHAIKEYLPYHGAAPAPEPLREDAGPLGHPGFFHCAAWLDENTSISSCHQLGDEWLAKAISAVDLDAAAGDELAEEGFRLYAEDAEAGDSEVLAVQALEKAGLTAIFGMRFFLAFMAARHLEKKSPGEIVGLLFRDPAKWTGPVRILGQRLIERDGQCDSLIEAVSECGGTARAESALLAASLLTQGSEGDAAGPWRRRIRDDLLRIATEGTLPAAWRHAAGRHLARLGDPRDLEALLPVSSGPFVMGTKLHANAEPPHRLQLNGFRIGKYPVTNGSYVRFVEATGRRWISEDGRHPERANAPAVNLTWEDARAYCEWLTGAWTRQGRIDRLEIVRLPTEPEWEKAARGHQPGAKDSCVYPWQGHWQADRTNAEEEGLNDTCAVGLYPKGVSPYGCHDMCGQVWEWTSSLWGEDMTSPAFAYPYREDGREDVGAGPKVRRVLRGGCFSSGRAKACCAYRGSLEPNGFWRGNGFRIVVARREHR